MANEYVARDPRTGKVIQKREKSVEHDIRSLEPIDGAWRRIPVYEILKLAGGDIEHLQLSLTNGGGFVNRIEKSGLILKIIFAPMNFKITIHPYLSRRKILTKPRQISK